VRRFRWSAHSSRNGAKTAFLLTSCFIRRASGENGWKTQTEQSTLGNARNDVRFRFLQIPKKLP
jgi:hypothetical protein